MSLVSYDYTLINIQCTLYNSINCVIVQKNNHIGMVKLYDTTPKQYKVLSFKAGKAPGEVCALKSHVTTIVISVSMKEIHVLLSNVRRRYQ